MESTAKSKDTTNLADASACSDSWGDESFDCISGQQIEQMGNAETVSRNEEKQSEANPGQNDEVKSSEHEEDAKCISHHHQRSKSKKKEENDCSREGSRRNDEGFPELSLQERKS